MARKLKIPMLGAARANPPRVFRPQKVVAELQKETRPVFKVGSTVTGPRDLVEYTLAEYMGERATEIFLVLYVDVRNRIVGYTEYASGSVAGVEVDPSGILRDALTSGASGFITIHNHPTGDATPSEADRGLWKRIRTAGLVVGMPCVDNLVVGENEYFSESEEENNGLGRTKFKRGQL